MFFSRHHWDKIAIEGNILFFDTVFSTQYNSNVHQLFSILVCAGYVVFVQRTCWLTSIWKQYIVELDHWINTNFWRVSRIWQAYSDYTARNWFVHGRKESFINRHMCRQLSQFQKVAVHCLKKFAKGSKLIVVLSLLAPLCLVELSHLCEGGESLLLHGDGEHVIAAFMIPYNVRVCRIELQCCTEIQQPKPRFHFCQWGQLVVVFFVRLSESFPNDSM